VLCPKDVKRQNRLRFTGARYLFEEWRDPSLSGLELYQRTLDWAKIHDLPIARQKREFTLRTYHNTRVANFHALMVQRKADNVEAHLALRPGSRGFRELGSSRYTTPRMIAAHHSLAIAFGRMLDETALTGQVNFRAEFDLTNVQSNNYPAIPDLSPISRKMRRVLPKVQIPEELLLLAQTRTDPAFSYLDIQREVEVCATYSKKGQTPFSFTSTRIGPDWIDEETETENVDDDLSGPYPGEDELFDALFPDEELMKQHLIDTPGCRSIRISYQAPIKRR
jgi:hypothetical protein